MTQTNVLYKVDRVPLFGSMRAFLTKIKAIENVLKREISTSGEIKITINF